MKLPHGGINIQYTSYNLGYHPDFDPYLLLQTPHVAGIQWAHGLSDGGC